MAWMTISTSNMFVSALTEMRADDAARNAFADPSPACLARQIFSSLGTPSGIGA